MPHGLLVILDPALQPLFLEQSPMTTPWLNAELTGMEVVGGLHVDDEGEPRVVQEIPRGVALGEDAETYARSQYSRRKPRDCQKHLRRHRFGAHVFVTDDGTTRGRTEHDAAGKCVLISGHLSRVTHKSDFPHEN